MCTVSWCLLNDGYHVFFNRDEQKTRALGVAPEVMSMEGVNVLMPIDPQGNGTWLAVNNFGCCFALLNYYQGRFPKGSLRSRGQLVKGLSKFSTLKEVSSHLESLNLNKYPPFSLLCFFPELFELEIDSPVNMLRWTGKTLELDKQCSPLISSSVKFSTVLEKRLAVYKNANIGRAKEPNEQILSKFINLHRSHEPTASEYSICMHREDAQTVSFSHVFVPNKHSGLDSIEFSYYPGSPCESTLPVKKYLKID